MNVHSDKFPNTNNNTQRGRRLPVVPLLGSSKLSELHQEDGHSSNHLFSVKLKLHIIFYGQSYNLTAKETTCLRGKTPPVCAILVALDQCGLRTVLVEKTHPGPFGFYVAIETLNGQRGIFISRISIASLSPMLSVGDEILYVDDKHVRGRSLETVQAAISGKTKILLVLLPEAENYVY
ncbi:unnamed protein product [Angiostrongylus costaricensis]|uniref:PDZ domain-containing protein n=1 Tax=Angiostrongylus costaricensis TaxID=334426 RepID=A0A3P7K0B7_ANGCS|nr:unnamed protein product [Angiostrongylus costaricensis]